MRVVCNWCLKLFLRVPPLVTSTSFSWSSDGGMSGKAPRSAGRHGWTEEEEPEVGDFQAPA